MELVHNSVFQAITFQEAFPPNCCAFLVSPYRATFSKAQQTGNLNINSMIPPHQM